MMQPQVWRRGVLALMLALVEVQAHADDIEVLFTCPPANCSYGEKSGTDEYFFNVSGKNMYISFTDGNYFTLTCQDSLTLDDPGMPRFKKAVRVKKVKLEKCAPPINRSYAAVLAAFNVAAFSEFLLYYVPAAVITREHLAGLQNLTRLELVGNTSVDVRLAPGALAALASASALHHLTLQSVRTSVDDLAHLPPSLQTLKQWSIKTERVHFNLLPNLSTLDVSENDSLTLNASNATSLKELCLSSPNNVVPEDALPPTLTKLVLINWNDTRPASKTNCAQLLHLRIFGTDNKMWPVSLPDEWVASCDQLKELHMYQVPVNGTLPTRLLAHASELESLTIQKCNMSDLPLGLLDDTPRLKFLDLSFNNLTELPSGLFMNTQLESLNLSHNQLMSPVADSLAAVTSLKVLRLNDNPHLGDLCSGGSGQISALVGFSPLKHLKSLSQLYLSNTRVSRICSDWRDDLRNLTTLNLEHTAIIDINLSHLQFRRRANLNAMVILRQDEFQLQYTRDNYNSALDYEGGSQAKVHVYGSLVCDCNAYWTVMEFKRSSKRTRNISLPKCQNLNLAKVDVDTLTCDATDKCASIELEKNCSCTGRDDFNHTEVVFVNCTDVGLTEMPRLPPATHKWRLHFANNHISNITADHVAHIEDIVELDLRNNTISRVDGQTTTKLASVSLWLGGNELKCGCESFGMLTALVGPNSRLRDKENVTCTDMSSLASAPLTPCDTQTAVVAGVLIVVLVAAVVVSVILARPATLEHVKLFLIWIGWMPPRIELADDDRRFDVFVSYAHEDEELVVEKLAARLESGPRPYRLCLHYRDWAPGEWIPAQIAASVRGSRRTVAMVSRAYLESGWARAEFREATAATLRDATPRLVVVLLEDPALLTLDPELSAYVRNNTYVRWDDPWFWEKLKHALPPPRRQQKCPPPQPLPAPSPAIPLEHNSANSANSPALACHTPCSA